MKFLKTRLVTITVTALICIALFAGVTFAAQLTKSVPSGFTPLVPQPGLEVYSDAGCTTPVASLAFGSLYPGDVSAPQTLYVKNVGQIAFGGVLISTLGLSTTQGTLSYSTNNFPLARDAVTPVAITLTVGSSPGSTPITFTTNFVGNY